MRRPTISKKVVTSLVKASEATKHPILGPMFRNILGPEATECVQNFGPALAAWRAGKVERKRVENAATPKA